SSGPVGPINQATGNFDATGFVQTPLTAGQYAFRANYLGDAEYLPSTGPCEPLQVVDARISIAPNGTNEVGATHTFTVTVQQDDGLPAGAPGGDAVTGFGPAAGASVTTSLTNSNGATATFNGGTCAPNGTTNAAGQCTASITSPTAGLTTANASAT